MIKTNPLIISASPRDIKEVSEAMSKIPCDKLFAKYYPEADAYRLLQEFFLEHKEYTHAVVCPDDLVVDRASFRILQWNVATLDPPYIAGCCPIFWGSHQYAFGTTQNVYGKPYHYETDEDIEAHKKIQKSHVIRVLWEGFACAWIRRDVFEKITFRPMYNGLAFDTAFSFDCIHYEIPQFVNTYVKMPHLKNKPGLIPTVSRTLNYPHEDRHMHYQKWDGEGKVIYAR